MKSQRVIANFVGILILLAFVIYGGGQGILESMLSRPNALELIGQKQNLFFLGIVLSLLNSVIVLGIGIFMYPILSLHSKLVALTYFSTRIFEALFLAIGSVALLSVLSLDISVQGVDKTSFLQLGIQVNTVGYQVAMLSLGLGSLFFTYSMFRSGIVPRLLAAWGFIGYVALVGGSLAELAGAGNLLWNIPGGLFEIVFSIWLFIKGFHLKEEKSVL